ncbi:hypothetical protein GCM10011511_39150 [Puia dinghuensis]|uniref:Uncharacterized protein n=1 Tax=Puia dinghuensis TaxID=1792502 RepID=A0A8J2UFX9_9BACT|nr:hypothetical protein GCM10011511_39150 [Puia dinghuensis]
MTGEKLTPKEDDPRGLPFKVAVTSLNAVGTVVTVLEEDEPFEHPAASAAKTATNPNKRFICLYLLY